MAKRVFKGKQLQSAKKESQGTETRLHHSFQGARIRRVNQFTKKMKLLDSLPLSLIKLFSASGIRKL